MNTQRHPEKKTRIFISYSHFDRELVKTIANALAGSSLEPMWDHDLVSGMRFSDQIKTYIEHAHVFAPIVSENSHNSVWMHAEIGYALALRIPVLPVAIDTIPKGIISDLQATCITSAQVASDDLKEELVESLILALERRQAETNRELPLFECTEDNTQRARLLADYADRVKSIGMSGKVRQKASLTSFHLPTEEVTDQIWRTYYERPTRDNRYLYECLRSERRSLEEHARQSGCKLILDSLPTCREVYKRFGSDNVVARTHGLLRFLESDVKDVQVAINDDVDRIASMTILGDWFSSEAASSKEATVLTEARFTRHAPTIERQLEDFDGEFNRLLAAMTWTPENSRSKAIDYLQEN